MRLIGHLSNETNARTFGDFLFVQGIDNRVEHQSDSEWAVWVNDEDQLEGAARLLADFQANPSDPKYQAQAKSAGALRAEHEKSEERWRKQVRGRRQLFRNLSGYGLGGATLVLMVVSVGVFILSNFGHNVERVMALFITNYSTFVSGDLSLPEVRRGQVWRLFTPMFIHFDILHIFFNMLWLRDLGSMIEGRQGSWQLIFLVMVIAPCSHVAELYFARTMLFGGMSGVVYGLFGYIWLRSRFDPGSGLFLHPTTVIMMMVWFVICLIGVVPAANVIHAVGLAIGLAWGYLSSLHYRLR